MSGGVEAHTLVQQERHPDGRRLWRRRRRGLNEKRAAFRVVAKTDAPHHPSHHTAFDAAAHARGDVEPRARELSDHVRRALPAVEDGRGEVGVWSAAQDASIRDLIVGKDDRDAFADAKRAAVPFNRNGEPGTARVERRGRVAPGDEGVLRSQPHESERNQGSQHRSTPLDPDPIAAARWRRTAGGGPLGPPQLAVPEPVDEVEHQPDRQPDPEPLPGVDRQPLHDVEAGERAADRHRPDKRHAEGPRPIRVGVAQHEHADDTIANALSVPMLVRS